MPRFFLMTMFAFLLIVVSGCATNYKLSAIKEARLYALEHHPELSEQSIHQIKFTVPEIQQKIIFFEESTGSSLDFAQTCFVWKLDDLDGKSMIIVGFGQRKLNDWYPIRSIVRRYRKINDGKKNADDSKVHRDFRKKRKKRRMERASK